MQKIIVLFGVSGCGKSTIGKRLSEDLQFGYKVISFDINPLP